MKNKEIIIDGLNVGECGFLHPQYGDLDCHIALAFTAEYEECTKCEQNPNCYYKQLKRKEQELQLAKQFIDKTLQFFNLTQYDWLADQNEITTEIEDYVSKLKTENEELKKENAEERINSYKQGRLFIRASNRVYNYEQALDEIEKMCRCFNNPAYSQEFDKIYCGNLDVNILDIIAKAKGEE